MNAFTFCFPLYFCAQGCKWLSFCYFYSLALQIESLKQPGIVPELLMDFVSQYCFRMPQEKECTSRKRFLPESSTHFDYSISSLLSHALTQFTYSDIYECIVSFLFFSCSRFFSKASDVLQALKKIKEKDTVGVRKSDNDRKRGIPVRLYKRCLRLEKRAAVMAQLT